MENPRHLAFGEFLRSRRARLTPASAGLSETRRRRTPGLRREEVAELAGIGVDWYIRLEQGRAVTPSPATVDALARALQLSKAEHTHLRELTRHADRPPFVRETVPDGIRRVVEGLSQPAYVTGRRWDVLAWNKAADKILGFSKLAERDRNTLISMLTLPASRRLFGKGWAEEARRMVAQFRATHDLWAGDPAFQDLLERLRQGSREFDGWWAAHDIGKSGGGLKRIYPPNKESVRLVYASFQANEDPALKLVIYAPE